MMKQKEREELEQQMKNKPFESKALNVYDEKPLPPQDKISKSSGSPQDKILKNSGNPEDIHVQEEKEKGDESSTLEYDPHNLDKALNRLANGLDGLGPDNVKKRYQPRASNVTYGAAMMKSKVKKGKRRKSISQENFKVSEEELTGENVHEDDEIPSTNSRGRANLGKE